jgi:hypothetical protein
VTLAVDCTITRRSVGPPSFSPLASPFLTTRRRIRSPYQTNPSPVETARSTVLFVRANTRDRIPSTFTRSSLPHFAEQRATHAVDFTKCVLFFVVVVVVVHPRTFYLLAAQEIEVRQRTPLPRLVHANHTRRPVAVSGSLISSYDERRSAWNIARVIDMRIANATRAPSLPCSLYERVSYQWIVRGEYE